MKDIQLNNAEDAYDREDCGYREQKNLEVPKDAMKDGAPGPHDRDGSVPTKDSGTRSSRTSNPSGGQNEPY